MTRASSELMGELISAGHPDYDQRRRGWNAMHDRHPSAIARCTSADEVVAAIAHARRNQLEIAVRCGGHSHPGHGSTDGGLVIDLGRMNGVDVDRGRGSVRVQGGALLGDLDRATQEHGRVVPAGVVSHTGVGGLTLGGGVGRLMRKFGLTIDSLRSAEVVTSDGRVVVASETVNPDLFWALRGGGGNFGVVTEFEFATYSLTQLAVLSLFHPLSDVREVLSQAQQVMADDAPPELAWASFVRKPPPMARDWIPAELVGQPGVLTVLEWSGDDMAEGVERLNALRAALPATAAGALHVVPFVGIQRALDHDFGHGLYSYLKAGFTRGLDDAFISVLIEHGSRVSSDLTQIELLAMGGVISDVAPDATAFPYRDVDWLFNIPAHWRTDAETAYEVDFVRSAFADSAPFMSGGVYANFTQGDETLAAAANPTEARTWQRLRGIKSEWDPDNVFRLNRNIEPLPRT
jgi:FAD/FMN-containing dehydrogenase